MAIPEDHLAKFHKMIDVKEMWEAIKFRFDGNDKSKKMQKYLLKHSSTNEVNIAFSVSTSFGHNSQKEDSLSYIDDLMYSFFANQSSGLQLDHEDFEQVYEFDLDEMDLKWQKKKNDVKARTTLLLSLPDEHQLRFSKYKTARELWAAVLKTFSGNEATKKTKKNLLKQQYGNLKAEGSETLEKTFNRLQVIIGQLQFMDVEIEQDDLNKKFLISLAPEWLMHTIVWRNRGDLDTMSLDDLYNHLKVYESEVQKKSEPNSQNMAFISSPKHSCENKDGNTACVSTASTNIPTASASVATISQDTACAYIASQSSGSQIKFEDINQIDEDDMEEMYIKWNMALLSMRADKASRSQERGRRDNYRQGSEAKEHAPKALMEIDGMR
uniref:Uncharacterized protein n=1 Tax=Tanacetum cinerariifolium TaxID=118510 RepID=A0A699I1H7_TANCI|nr:hypothetical protein [Tanacetum cinerariifolium]